MGHSAPKTNILNFALQYDQEISGNIVSRQPQPHLCLERSFRGDRNIAGNRRQICETERSSLDFRPATSASKVRNDIHIACYLLVFCSLHLQSPSSKTFSGPSCWSLLQSCMWWASRTRIFRNTQIVHLFLEVFRFLSWSKVHLHLLSEVVVSFIWSGNKLTCAA